MPVARKTYSLAISGEFIILIVKSKNGFFATLPMSPLAGVNLLSAALLGSLFEKNLQVPSAGLMLFIGMKSWSR